MTARTSARRRAATAAAVLAILLSACAEDPAEDRGPQPDGAVEHDLFTHCGVSAVDVGGDLYLRVGGKLGDGSSPPGWGDPFQKGWVVVEGAVATFTDGCGLRRYMAGFCRSSVAASKHAGKRALRVRLTFRKPMGYWCIYNAVQRYDGRRRRAAAAHHW